MKAIKYIFITIAAVIALFLVIALFIPKEMSYEKSITINAPIEVVWENVNSLAGLDDWSPWNAKDPNMKKSWTGVDGTIGARQTWESDVKDVGSGYQEIVKIEPMTYFETTLKFYEPYESEAVGFVKLEQVGNNEIVATWGFSSEVPYPFNMMNAFTDLDQLMGEDWNKGLSRLKFLCEI